MCKIKSEYFFKSTSRSLENILVNNNINTNNKERQHKLTTSVTSGIMQCNFDFLKIIL